MMRLLNALTGKCHWYSVTFDYMTRNGEILFSKNMVLGVAHPGEILHHRQMKKLGAGKFMNHSVAKRFLCNGLLEMQIIASLGKFRMPENCSTAVQFDAVDICYAVWQATGRVK